MKKISMIMVAVCTTMFAVSCGGSGGGSNSPSGISKAITVQLQKGNYEKAFEIMADNIDKEFTAEEKAQFVKGFAELSKKAAEEAKKAGKAVGIKSFEILSEEISEDGNSATVKVKIVNGDGSDETTSYMFVKKDGVWKLKFM